MSATGQVSNIESTPSSFHRLLDWAIFPASIAAAIVVGFSFLFGSVNGRRADSDTLKAAVAAVSDLTAALITRTRLGI